MSEKKPTGVSNFKRRTWNLDDYKEKAGSSASTDLNSDENAKKYPKLKRTKGNDDEGGIEFAKPHQEKIDFEKNTGKRQTFTGLTPDQDCGGYYCKECKCLLHDSISYLDHINGKKHQRNLGRMLNVKSATVDDVKAALAMSYKKKEQEQMKNISFAELYEMKKEQKAVREKEEEQKKENEETPKEDPSPEKETPSKEEDSSLQALLGFSNFKAKRR